LENPARSCSATRVRRQVRSRPSTCRGEFVELAEQVIRHRAEDRFALLYRLLWRLAAEPALLRTPTDPDVVRAEDYRRQVATAVHKMHAFVRFRLVEGEETYVAWFEPAHRVVELAAPFFTRRFANQRFSILTPSARPLGTVRR
jgi:DNA polymerase